MLTTRTARLIEIFSGIQGEGPIVGRRQVFVRFGECDVQCDYCDTPLCHVELDECRIESAAGSRRFEKHGNPVEPTDLVSWIRRLDEGVRHHSVSFTGGEPLLHAPIIVEVADELRAAGLRLYLETNGHLVDAMRQVGAGIDIVGMDIKLESTAGFPARFDANREFLRTALDHGCETFVKLVVGERTAEDELTEALAVVRDVEPSLHVILQPVTPFAGRGTPPTPDRLLGLQTIALGMLEDVRVIPQTHKIIDQL